MTTMCIDCNRCAARGPACGDCVISVLLGAPGEKPVLNTEEQEALAVMAASGLLPRLRMVSAVASPFAEAERVI